jgi:signal transduction histidine kinase
VVIELGLLLSIAICGWIAVDTARVASPRGRRLPIVVLALGVGLWAAGELGVSRAADPAGVVAARRVLYAGSALVPAAWLWAAADATHRRRVRATPLRVALLLLPGLAAWSLLWTDHSALFVAGGARPAVFGPLFWPIVVWSWLLTGLGTAGFVAAARRLGKADPARVAAIGLGACVPLAGNLVYLLGGASGIDPTPAIVGAGVLVVRLFVFDAGLAAFLPVARRDVIEQLDSAVLVADLDGAIVDANAAAVALAAGGLLAGRPLDEVLAELASDPQRALELRRAPVCGRRGPVGSFAVVTDRTEARRRERQLQLAQKLEALGVLTAGIAHEVNNPLAYVRANLAALAELAEALPDPAVQGALPAKLVAVAREAPDLVSESIEGVERIGRLVRRLRRFARDGGDGSTRTRVDLASAARRARALAAVGLEPGAIRLSLQPAPFVLADEDALVQIAVNLLVNAIQAGGPRAEIELEVAAARGGAALRVRDRGPGISAAAFPRLFDPFFTTKPPGEGTGLGLSLSFDLARENQGVLEARNRDGGGAEFELWLPAAPAEAERDVRT